MGGSCCPDQEINRQVGVARIVVRDQPFLPARRRRFEDEMPDGAMTLESRSKVK